MLFRSAHHECRALRAEEEDLRLMELLSGDAVTCIDAYMAGSGKSLKTLFQHRSTPDAISVVCVPLGKRIGDKLFQVPRGYIRAIREFRDSRSRA